MNRDDDDDDATKNVEKLCYDDGGMYYG